MTEADSGAASSPTTEGRRVYRFRMTMFRRVGAEYVARFTPQPRAVAIGTGEIAAVAAEKHADVDLVFLPLEPAEEAAHALVITTLTRACRPSTVLGTTLRLSKGRRVAVDGEPALVVRQVGPWDVEAHA